MVDTTLLAGAGLVAALLCLSAFFSASEIALFSLPDHRVAAVAERSDPSATALVALLEEPHRLLVTVLVGNNVVNVAMTSVATVLLSLTLGAGVGVTVATVGMSALVLVVGEITPKSYGVANAETLSLRVARPLTAVGRLLSPLVFVFEGVSRLVNRATGGSSDIERPYLRREDIADLLRTSEAAGAIGADERRMVTGVFDLSTTPARAVMVPRGDVVAVDAGTSLPDVVATLADAGVTRAPVYEGTLDTVVGVVDIRDAERAARDGGSLSAVLRPVLQAPDSREIDELLAEMREADSPLAVVRDEFGETEGVVTVEDIVAEIVGDVAGAGQRRRIRPADGGAVVDGDVTVADLGEMLGVSLPRDGSFATVAGLVNDRLGRVGEAGDVVRVAGLALTVVGVAGRRVETVRVERVGGDAAPDDGEDGNGGEDAGPRGRD
jgi:CBS domain containing-hemolysin-like protein